MTGNDIQFILSLHISSAISGSKNISSTIINTEGNNNKYSPLN